MKDKYWFDTEIDKIMRLREEGATLQKIGDTYSVTKERARQVIEKELERRRLVEERKSCADILDSHIETLMLPKRLHRALEDLKITTLRELVKLNKREVLSLPNCGSVALKMLSTRLLEAGISWPIN